MVNQNKKRIWREILKFLSQVLGLQGKDMQKLSGLRALKLLETVVSDTYGGFANAQESSDDDGGVGESFDDEEDANAAAAAAAAEQKATSEEVQELKALMNRMAEITVTHLKYVTKTANDS